MRKRGHTELSAHVSAFEFGILIRIFREFISVTGSMKYSIANSVTWPNYSSTIVSQRTALEYVFSLCILYDLAPALKLETYETEKSWCVLVTGVISEMFGWADQLWGNWNKMYTYTSESIFSNSFMITHCIVFYITFFVLFSNTFIAFLTTSTAICAELVHKFWQTKQTSPTHSYMHIHIHVFIYIYIYIYCSTIFTHIDTFGWMYLICSISE